MQGRAFGFVSASLLLLWSGCNLNTDYFSDYRGKNILGNSDFGSGKWALVSDSTLKNNASLIPAYAPTDYMSWEGIAAAADPKDSSAGTPTTGPDGSSPSYRLEIKNLIPNGDFENYSASGTAFVAPDTSYWSVVSSASLLFQSSGVSVSPAPGFIDHMSLYFNGIPAAGGRITLQLDAAVTQTTSGFWLRAGSYRFRYEFYQVANSTQSTVWLTGGTTSTMENNGTWDQSVAIGPSAIKHSLSDYFYNNGSTPLLVEIGDRSSGSDQLVIDNVRLLNTSVDPSVMLTFSSLSSGGLKLLPGSKSGAYSFSLKVKDDPTADQTNTSGHKSNRFYASGITVTLTAAVQSGAGTYTTFVARPPGGWTSWTTVTIPFGFDFVGSDSALNGSPALTISLSPTNVSNTNVQANGNSTVSPDRDVGSLLVAQPVLNYNP